MTKFFHAFLIAFALIFIGAPALHAADAVPPPERSLGKPDAPIRVDEFASLTCSHCAEFTNKTLPDLEKRYVETGKVRFVFHDFPLDGLGLKAAILARCMPENQYYPFIKILYSSQGTWVVAQDPEFNLIQYAKLGGLDEAKARACLQDTGMQDSIVAERTEATEKYGVEATPTFVINNSDTVKGAQGPEAFAQIFDRILAQKK